MLSDGDLARAVLDDRFKIVPFDPMLIQPASIDVRLDRVFRVFDNHRYSHIDPAAEQPNLTQEVSIGAGEQLVLHPGEFILGSTVEAVSLGRDVAARLEGKSSLGRLGLVVHSTAGFIDPGFEGTITVELANLARLPILLRPGMLIGQLCVFALSSPAAHAYGERGNRYQGQRGPTASRSHRGFSTWVSP